MPEIPDEVIRILIEGGRNQTAMGAKVDNLAHAVNELRADLVASRQRTKDLDADLNLQLNRLKHLLNGNGKLGALAWISFLRWAVYVLTGITLAIIFYLMTGEVNLPGFGGP